VADVPACSPSTRSSPAALPEPPLTVAAAEAEFAGIAADPDRTVLVATVDGAVTGTADLLIVRPSLTHGAVPGAPSKTWSSTTGTTAGGWPCPHG